MYVNNKSQITYDLYHLKVLGTTYHGPSPSRLVKRLSCPYLTLTELNKLSYTVVRDLKQGKTPFIPCLEGSNQNTHECLFLYILHLF